MDQYFYVLEPGRAAPDGPFLATEITRRMATGEISAKATLSRVGDANTQDVSNQASPRLVDRLGRVPGLGYPEQIAGAGAPPEAISKDELLDLDQELALVARAAEPAPPAPPPRIAAPRPPWMSRRLALGLGIGGGAVGIVALSAALLAGRSHGAAIKDAMVRVSTSSGTGAGFFIDGPDELHVRRDRVPRRRSRRARADRARCRHHRQAALRRGVSRDRDRRVGSRRRPRDLRGSRTSTRAGSTACRSRRSRPRTRRSSRTATRARAWSSTPAWSRRTARSCRS